MTGWTTTRIGPSPHIAVDHMGAGDLVVFLHGIGGNKRNWHPNVAAFARHWHAVAWDARGYGERMLMIEPGRSLVGNAGLCLAEVLVLKPGEQKNFCIIDAAMNDLPRPAMYQAFHAIEPATKRGGDTTTYDVVGPICESGDWIGRDRALDVQAGDLLVVLSAGAYCMSMASNYNTRGRAAEVMVRGDQAWLIREREQPSELFRGERLLPV